MPSKCVLLGNILLLLVLQFVLETRSSNELRKIEISDSDAICNDHSRAVFYTDSDGKRSPKKWIIFFESGGLCTSKADCNRRYKNKNSTVLMSSNTLPNRVTGRDLLSSSESKNPTFHDYVHVLVPYCSSDLWLGHSSGLNRTFVFRDDSTVDNFVFRGQNIFRSVFEKLKSNLSFAEEVVVSGSSAGGIGVLNHAKWLANILFAQSQAKLLFIIDSAWFINFQDGFRSRVKPEFHNLTNISSQACADLSYGYSCCLSAPCLMSRGFFPSDKPVAFVFSLYDIYMFADVLKRLESEGKTVEDNLADYISVVSMYGGAMNESLELPKNKGSNASFFVPACFQHTYFSTSSLWDKGSVLNPLVEVTRGTGKFSHRIKSGTWASTAITKGVAYKTSIQDFLSSWVKSDHKEQLIDSCIGAHCNPTCPDEIVFVDAGEVWTKVVKAIVVGLSLVITVLCSGLKATFVCHYSYLTKRQENYLNDIETSQARKELPLCKSDEAVSLACLSLTYTMDVAATKKKRVKHEIEREENGSLVKADRDSKISSVHSGDTTFDEESSSDLQEDELDPSWTLPRKLQFDTNRDTDSVNSLQERKPDSSMNGNSTVGSRTGSDLALLRGNHGNGDSGSFSFAVPVSKDATSYPEMDDGSSTKQILKGVSAYFNTGELVAIMGPSGCGKTTLLDLLTGRRRRGHIEGQVYINGVSLGRVQDWFARKVGYVLQLAVPYYEELTVRQNLFFAAHMRLPKETSASEKYERVEQIIAETGLTQMADTVIGGSVGPGLSGGQKRRLCVALQLINMPSVLFLDEPTSGLDASSSLEMLNHLNLVAESGRLVILTIHQPRLEIFHLFHKILFLCDGQVAYYGEPCMAPEIFIKAYARAATEEYQFSEEAPKIDAKNPADTIMDLLNCPEARRAILDYYQTSGEPQAVQEAIMTSQENARKTVSMETMTTLVDGAGPFNRIFVLEGRTAEKQTLGQLLYFPLIFFTFGIIVGTVYWQAEERDGILLMSAYCVYCCASPLFLSSVLMAHLNKALNIFHLERADGCGRSHENVIQTFVRTTAMCVLPVILCSVMSYFMVMTSYDLWKLVLVTIISLVLNQTWIAVYMMVICAQPKIAHRICPMVSAIGGFAGGFLVPRPQMPIVYNLLFYINPQFYGYAAITKVLLQDVRLTCEYESTLSCISTDGNAVLTRFGLETVNPYEHLVIMLGMTVLSLLLSWLFLEAKYFTLRCFAKTPQAFSVEAEEVEEEEKVEVLVKPADDTLANEDKEGKDEIQMETPESCRINPRSATRRSAKSRLGLIRGNHGFHSVKLPAPKMERADTPEMIFNADQTTDGELKSPKVSTRRRNRVTSVSGQELWKHTKLHMEERKIDFEKRLSKVQNIARNYSIKHSQSMRRRSKERPVIIPRRTTLAASAFSEAKRQELSLKHNGNLEEGFKKFLEEEFDEEQATLPVHNLRKSEDFFDGGNAFRAVGKKRVVSETSIKEEDEGESENGAGMAPTQEATQQEKSKDVGHENAVSRKPGEGGIQANRQPVDNSEERVWLDKDKDQLRSRSPDGDGEKEIDNKMATRFLQTKKEEEERPVKRVTILELTETLDV